MSIESIKKTLEERFAQPLDEYCKRRIVFWEDAEQKFTQEVDDLSIEGVKILKLTGSNYFSAKKLLLNDDTESNYIVYNPTRINSPEEDWLYDIRLYSGEPFYADKLSLQMDEYGIDSTHEMREAIKCYPKFFDNKERTDKLRAYGKTYGRPYDLHIDILCALCGIESGSVQDIITAILLDGTDESTNRCMDRIAKFGNPGVLWAFVHKATGYVYNPDADNLSDLAAHIFFTAAVQTVSATPVQWNDYISPDHSAFCYGLVHDMLYYSDEQSVYNLCRETEVRFSLENTFSKLDVQSIVNCDIFPCINTCILTRYFTEIGRNTIRAEEIQRTVEARRTLKWYDRLSPYFDGLQQIADMQLFYQKWADSFHEVDPLKVWTLYTEELYKMDTYYRLFHLAFGNSLKDSYADIDDLYKSAADVVEQLYQNWYLKELTAMWFNAADGYLLDHNRCNIPRQVDFYNTFVKKEKENHTVFVIISDALRFEVAAELQSVLEMQNRGAASVTAVKSVFPSVTHYGMAALLPADERLVSDSGDVTADGMPCKTTEQRKAVLRAAEPASFAIQYKDFVAMKKEERNSVITGNKVIYIYHNTIDAVGDKPATEQKVFEACSETVSELQNLIRIISGLRNGSRIIVTADHGFMYTYSPLGESQKISSGAVDGALENGRRYIVGKGSDKSGLLVPVQMEINNADKTLVAYSPADTVRIKMSGGGANYVHGGASLQEMCVPVITFRSVRLDSKEFRTNREKFEAAPVEIKLLASANKISNMAFSYYLLQTEPVGKSKKAAGYRLYFVDGLGNKISDVQKIVADKTDGEQQQRQFRCSFNLKSLKYSKNSKYYLVCIDDNADEKWREEFIIDIPYALDDFLMD